MSVTTVSNREEMAAARHDVRGTRWVATIFGLIGFVLSVATPLLPVVQTTATLNWPQGGQLNSVTAPLISLTPVDVTVTVPCSVVRALPPEGGVILSTAPKKGKDAALNALFVVASSKRVDVTDRNVVIASVPRDQAESAQCQRIEITSTKAGAFATFVGLNDPAGKPVGGGFPDPNLRPQIVGVFTDLTGPAPPGLRLSATIDTRFSTTPTTLKLVAMVLAIVSTIVVARRAVAPRSIGWQTDAPAHPGELAQVHSGRRHGHLRLLVVACDRRELLRRRLHPGHGARRRSRRLHVQLLPLVWQSRGPVRLVLQPAVADDPRQRRQPVDAITGLGRGSAVLAAAVA